jgi:hypothetical protein
MKDLYKQVTERIESVKDYLTDDITLLQASSSMHFPNRTSSGRVPIVWRETAGNFDSREMSIVRASLTTARVNLRILNLGYLRRVGLEELSSAKYIGVARASILKAFGDIEDESRRMKLSEFTVELQFPWLADSKD